MEHKRHLLEGHTGDLSCLGVPKMINHTSFDSRSSPHHPPLAPSHLCLPFSLFLFFFRVSERDPSHGDAERRVWIWPIGVNT